MDSHETVQAFCMAQVRTARIAERLRASMVATLHVVEALGAVGELTDDTTNLAPEILTAIEHASELAQVIERAVDTAILQMDIKLEKLAEEDADHAEG